MKNLQMTPNTEHNATADEVRASMMRWFAETFGDEYTVEEWRSFKAHQFPDPVASMPAPSEPDYEGMYLDRLADRNY